MLGRFGEMEEPPYHALDSLQLSPKRAISIDLIVFKSALGAIHFGASMLHSLWTHCRTQAATNPFPPLPSNRLRATLSSTPRGNIPQGQEENCFAGGRWHGSPFSQPPPLLGHPARTISRLTTGDSGGSLYFLYFLILLGGVWMAWNHIFGGCANGGGTFV